MVAGFFVRSVLVSSFAFSDVDAWHDANIHADGLLQLVTGFVTREAQ